MRKFFFIFSYLLYAIFYPLAATAQSEWKEEKGDHFIVYSLNEAARPKEVIRKAELYYNRIAEDLGYARHSDFWQWEKRVKIYIHPSKEAFQQATGQPVWSHGMASYFDKTIHSIETNADFLEKTLPHEIAHLIFRDFVGFKGEVPLWLDEGVAQWEEDDKRREALAMMPELASRGEAFTLQSLMMTDIRRETNPVRVAVFYTQAISLVDFLVSRFGPASFTAFCRELRDGKDVQAALRVAYPGSLSSIEEMEDRWWKYLRDSKSASREETFGGVLTS
jgi:hypothetical protein